MDATGTGLGICDVTTPAGTAGLEALSGSPGRGRSERGAARLARGCARLRCSRGQWAGRRPGPGRCWSRAGLRRTGTATPKVAHRRSELAFRSLQLVRILLALCSLASLTLNTTDFSCFTSALCSVQTNSQLPFAPTESSAEQQPPELIPCAPSLLPTLTMCCQALPSQPSALKTKLKRSRKPKQP